MNLTVTTNEAAAILGLKTGAAVRMLVLRGDLQPLVRGVRPLTFHETDVIELELARRTTEERDQVARLAETWRSLA